MTAGMNSIQAGHRKFLFQLLFERGEGTSVCIMNFSLRYDDDFLYRSISTSN